MVRRANSSSRAFFPQFSGTNLVFQQSPHQLDHSRYIPLLRIGHLISILYFYSLWARHLVGLMWPMSSQSRALLLLLTMVSSAARE